MIKIIDYVWYRYYLFYKKKRETIPVFTASLISTIYINVFIINVMGFASLFPIQLGQWTKLLVMIFGISTFIIVHRRYSDKIFINYLLCRYANEDKRLKLLRGWIITLYTLFSFILLISWHDLRLSIHNIL